jgi:outer membrane protein assembly factor BamB
MLVLLLSCQDMFDFTPPKVTLLSPHNGSEIQDSVLIIARASDNRQVKEIRILLNDQLDTSALADSIACERVLPDSGAHFIQARAVDRHGNWGTSNRVSVNTLVWRDSLPTVPARPIGVSGGMIPWNQAWSFSTVSTDPAGRQIRYVFDWDDGEFDTTGFFASGETSSAAHTWIHGDTCAIRALALNSSGRRSVSWSDTSMLVVTFPPPVPVEIAWWSCPPGGDAFNSSPAIGMAGGDTVVYVGCDDGHIYGIHARAGVNRGIFPSLTGSSFSSSPVVSADGQHVYVADDTGWVYCLSATLGLLSHYPLQDTWAGGMAVFSTPAIRDNAVFVGCDDGFVYRLNDEGGLLTRVAACSTCGAISSSPAINASGTRIVVGNDSGWVYCFDDSLRVVWSVLLASAVGTAPAIGGSTVYLGTLDGQLHSLNLGDGSSVNPPFQADAGIVSSPVIDAGSNVYFVTLPGTAFCIRNGAEVWRQSLPYHEYVSATCCLAPDTTLILNTDSGSVYGLDCGLTQPGAIRYRIEWPRPPAGPRLGQSIHRSSSPTVGTDNGLFYAGSPTGGFFAVRVNKPSFQNGVPVDAPWPKFQHDIRNSGRQQ